MVDRDPRACGTTTSGYGRQDTLMHGEDMIATAAPISEADDARAAENPTVEEELADVKRQLEEAHKVMWSLYKELDDKNAALKSSNDELDQFATIAGHDLQEPLRKVISFGRMLSQEYGDSIDETGRDYVERMQGASERMLELLADLLRYARVTSQAKAFEATDLGSIAEVVVADLGEQIRRENGDVQVGPMPIIEADPVQVRQLLQNLVSNALKFHHADRAPVVNVTADLIDEDHVAVSVTDNGIGFKPKFAERIFQPFRRLHGQGQYDGTGMGLAIVKKIAERHGGSVEVQSEPELGSRFVITLPRRRQADDFSPSLVMSEDHAG